MSVRAMLGRVRRLEQARTPSSPFVIWFGSLDCYVETLRAGIAAGALDPTDVPVVIASIERWHRDGVWPR